MSLNAYHDPGQLSFRGHPNEPGLRAGPTEITIIRMWPHKPLLFADLEALARHVHRERRGRGLQIAAAYATWHGSDTFPILKLWWLVDDDAEYAAALAIQGRDTAFEAALAATDPDAPAALRKPHRQVLHLP